MQGLPVGPCPLNYVRACFARNVSRPAKARDDYTSIRIAGSALYSHLRRFPGRKSGTASTKFHPAWGGRAVGARAGSAAGSTSIGPPDRALVSRSPVLIRSEEHTSEIQSL